MPAQVGAHLNGGVKGALDHARRIGLGNHRAAGPTDVPGSPAAGDIPGAAATGGPIQLWSRNPSAWRPTAHRPEDVARFRDGCVAADLGPIFTHGIYLMNFASPDDTLWERSIEALVDQLIVGAQLGAKAVIVHPGSGVTLEPEAALDRCAAAIRRALQQTGQVAERPLVGLETCAGAGRTIGRTFGELAALLDRLDGDPGAAIVLDTAHLWGSGADLATESGLLETLTELAATLPAERVIAVHANDSKVARGSHRDRHENIGQGTIGEAAFTRMLAHPLLRDLPWILEVPGYDGEGPDAPNLEVLRRLAAGTG